MCCEVRRRFGMESDFSLKIANPRQPCSQPYQQSHVLILLSGNEQNPANGCILNYEGKFFIKNFPQSQESSAREFPAEKFALLSGGLDLPEADLTEHSQPGPSSRQSFLRLFNLLR